MAGSAAAQYDAALCAVSSELIVLFRFMTVIAGLLVFLAYTRMANVEKSSAAAMSLWFILILNALLTVYQWMFLPQCF